MSLARKIWILFAALFFAVLLYTYVHLSGTNEVEMDVPLEVTSPDGYALTTELPPKIHAKFRGPGWRLLLMNFSSSTKFTVDLAERSLQTLQSKSYLTIDDLQSSPYIPSDVTILVIEPDSLPISFAHETSKRVPIRLRLDIEPAEGYIVIDEPVISPAFVTVKGSNSILDSLRFLPTSILRARNVRESFSVQLELSDTLRESLTAVSASKINVNVEVQAIAEKSIADIPITIEALPPDREMFLVPSAISVVMRGGVDVLAKLDPKTIKAVVFFDAAKLDSAESVKPTIELPKGIEFLSTEPSSIKFVLRKK